MAEQQVTRTRAKGKTAVPESAEAETRRTDLGNAERMAGYAKGKMLWVHGMGWLCWDGKRWQRDTSNRAIREAGKVARSIYREAEHINRLAAEATDDDERAKWAKAAKETTAWAITSENATRIEKMLKLAAAHPDLVLKEGAAALDQRPEVLNVQNGILDLDTLELREADPKALLSKVTRAAHNPGAKAPRWEEFLATILPDAEIRDYVQKAIGYSLLGRFSEYLFIPYGSGANGKSTFLHVIRHALGDYADEAATELLVNKREWGAASDAALADLRGRRFVTTIETAMGRPLAEVFVKQLTGEGVLKAKFMRQDYFSFENQAAIWLATNHKPRIQGADEGIWRRIRLIPFEVFIPEDKRDETLRDKLVAKEIDGVLTWAIEGLHRYRNEGLEMPTIIKDQIELYRREMDPVAEWFDEACRLDPAGFTTIGALRDSYEDHCRHSGRKPFDSRDFNAALRSRGLEDAKTGGKRGWKGVRLWQDEVAERLASSPVTPAAL